ncbi:hypothetical protein M409DRAFT_28670 [Zasmidium cellare ATCC 36951]|uniref:Ribosomal protein L1 n=1 Tax=Zasmidium cellare ATCC 36951 TaxID=1080233 RepID=A0A6A6C153_ZASCE|nr:uncharacterized protein M409DRAFT_28670 [Zasmidium cellare ATCC 36951]KAF2160787.1 hypothetical protein M409DRAFT_28670 [Zasmidium cellare ATCC 36951]
MAPKTTAVATKVATDSASRLDSAQTLRASTALLRKIQSDVAGKESTAEKTNLLEDADDEDASDEVPLWLVLTTKKHIVDKKRLKPGKIVLPHPYLNTEREGLRICVITADPQRRYKDLVAGAGFPIELSKKIGRVIGLEKLKSKYKSYESRRQLRDEYDVFLADDRIVTYLPTVMGKVFYKGGAKRPIPISLEGKRENVDEKGNKRQKLSEGGSKVTKKEARSEDVAREVQKTLNSALVHLAPSTTTAIKVGVASQSAEEVQENVQAVVDAMVETYVPQKWNNVRSIHIKGPDTAALPIWLAEELWTDEKDVLEEAPKANVGKKRKRGALAEAAASETTIEVPGPDGQMRRLEKPSSKRKSVEAKKEVEPEAVPAKKRKSESKEDAEAKAAEKAEKAARKEALKKEKESAKADVKTKSKAAMGTAKAGKKSKAKA